MNSAERKDRAAGAIMGTLIGDALGVGPHWYYDLDQLKQDYGTWIDDYTEPRPDRYHAGLHAGENSQTGQVATFLLQSVAALGAYREAEFTRRLDTLLSTLDGTPEAGRYTDVAMRDVWHTRRAGKEWRRAGSLADTADAAIRLPILAARYHSDFKRLVAEAISNVGLTHRDPSVAGQSVAFALIVSGVINGSSLEQVSRSIVKQAEDLNVELAIRVSGADHSETRKASFFDAVLQPSWSYAAAHDPAVQIDPPQMACRLFGLACPLRFMLPAAYYFAARFENDFEMAVLSAINGGGNNMARASLTGALAGARAGLIGIPKRFIAGLDQHERLLEMATRLAEASENTGSNQAETEQKPERPREISADTTADTDVCTKAPEWAEHHRFSDDDQPCDDGRSGKI